MFDIQDYFFLSQYTLYKMTENWIYAVLDKISLKAILGHTDTLKQSPEIPFVNMLIHEFQ